MECGRAVQRGLVTPDRTTLIASTHRIYSIAEKTALGDGRVDSAALIAHAAAAAKRFIRFDMAETAEQTGSVISAVLFGALAGTGVLPFSRAQFEATIARGGVGVAPSLKAFETAYRARGERPDGKRGDPRARPHGDEAHGARQAVREERYAGAHGDAWLRRPHRRSTEPPTRRLAVAIAARSSRRMRARGAERPARPPRCSAASTARFCRRLGPSAAARRRAPPDRLPGPGVRGPLPRPRRADRRAAGRVRDADRRDRAPPRALDVVRGHDPRRRAEDARHPLRARARRGARRPDQVLAIDEYLHPRVQEIAETLPGALGRWLERPGPVRRIVER
jgi:indolepyruvate ferredoxin oxidoreductase beta subunit